MPLWLSQCTDSRPVRLEELLIFPGLVDDEDASLETRIFLVKRHMHSDIAGNALAPLLGTQQNIRHRRVMTRKMYTSLDFIRDAATCTKIFNLASSPWQIITHSSYRSSQQGPVQ